MASVNNIFGIIEELQGDIQSEINKTMTEIVKETNESLARMLTSTIRNAEKLENYVNEHMSRMKLSFKDCLVKYVDIKESKKFRDGGNLNNSQEYFATETIYPERDKTHKKYSNSKNVYSFNNDPIANHDDANEDYNTYIKEEFENEILPGSDTSVSIKNHLLTSSTMIREKEKLHFRDSKDNGQNAKISQAYKKLLYQNEACDQCNYVPAFKHDLVKHVLAVHERRKDFQCEECDYASAHKTSVKRHIRTVHAHKGIS